MSKNANRDDSALLSKFDYAIIKRRGRRARNSRNHGCSVKQFGDSSAITCDIVNVRSFYVEQEPTCPQFAESKKPTDLDLGAKSSEVLRSQPFLSYQFIRRFSEVDHVCHHEPL